MPEQTNLRQATRPDHTSWSFPTALLRFRDVAGKPVPGEARITYCALYTELGAVDRTIEITKDEVAHLAGLSHHGAKRALERLQIVGLIEKLDQHGDRWIIQLRHPLQAERVRLGQKDDRQLALPAVEPAPEARAQAPTEAHAQPLRLRLRPKTSPNVQGQRESPKSKSVFEPSLSPSQRASGCASASGAAGALARPGSAGEGDRPRPLTDVMSEWFSKQPDAGDVARQVDQLADAIENQVADPLLKRSVALKAASAVVDGRLKRRELHRIFEYVDEQTKRGLKVGRWAAFVGALRTRFREDGIDW